MSMSFDDYQFDSRLAFAATIPASWYFDPQILAREQETVFAHTWQLVGRSEQVAAPGAYFTTTIADEPIIVVRGADEKLRALSNVCTIAPGQSQRAQATAKSCNAAITAGRTHWTDVCTAHPNLKALRALTNLKTACRNLVSPNGPGWCSSISTRLASRWQQRSKICRRAYCIRI